MKITPQTPLTTELHVELGKIAHELGLISLDDLTRALVALGRTDDGLSAEAFWFESEFMGEDQLAAAIVYLAMRHSSQADAEAAASGSGDVLALEVPSQDTCKSPPALPAMSLADVLRTKNPDSVVDIDCDIPAASAVSISIDFGTIDITDEVEVLGDTGTWPFSPRKAGRRRYVLGRELGRGGGGRVIRSFDRDLGRTVAMKILTIDPAKDEQGRREALSRFVAEAQATGQLEHPNIIPIYDMGVLETGELFYTMKEVRRHSLREVVEGLADGLTVLYEEYTLSRLLQIFKTVCQAMSYAHSRGVVHRDLKPDNVMLGDYGEVLVTDWGLARVMGREVVTDFSLRGGHKAKPGQTLGTPSYMPPEQAKGELDEVDELSDVYSLGALLYEILTLLPPFLDDTAMKIMIRVVDEPLTPPSRLAPDREIPAELEAICLKAMAYDKGDRYDCAAALTQAIEGFIDGIQASEAQRRFRAGEQHAAAYFRAIEHVADLERRVRDAHATVQPWEGAARKRLVWALEDQVAEAQNSAAAAFGDAVTAFTQALAHKSDHDPAREGLAQLYWSRFKTAEEHHDPIGATYFHALIRQYDNGSYQALIEGHGELTLMSSPDGAQVFLERCVEKDRRLVNSDRCLLGETPIRNFTIPMGSYLLTLKHEGYRTQKLPVHVGRCADVNLVVDLIKNDDAALSFVHVPAGLFTMGGDAEAFDARDAQETFVDGYLISRYPVTFREYLEYVNWLLKHRPAEVSTRLPQTRGAEGLLVGWDAALEMYTPRDIVIEGSARQRYPRGRGVEWDLPVFGICFDDAVAYAAWRSKRDGRTYRLPTEAEWEKAARGTDGRAFPWGEHFDPTFCKMRFSRPEAAQPEPVGAFKADESPWGVRDCAGGVREWVADSNDAERPIHPDSQTCIVRGGGWTADQNGCRVASRRRVLRVSRNTSIGFRLVCDIPDGALELSAARPVIRRQPRLLAQGLVGRYKQSSTRRKQRDKKAAQPRED